MFLLDQSTKNLQCAIYEFNVMAKIHGVEVEIPEGAKTYFEQVASVNPHIFAIQNGQPVMVQNDMTETVMSALKNKMNSEEALKQIYATMAL